MLVGVPASTGPPHPIVSSTGGSSRECLKGFQVNRGGGGVTTVNSALDRGEEKEKR